MEKTEDEVARYMRTGLRSRWTQQTEIIPVCHQGNDPAVGNMRPGGPVKFIMSRAAAADPLHDFYADVYQDEDEDKAQVSTTGIDLCCAGVSPLQRRRDQHHCGR